MKITQQAADPKAGMTLDEAARLIQQAMRNGMPGGVGFRGQIRELWIGE
jgi:hypothetical protein